MKLAYYEKCPGAFYGQILRLNKREKNTMKTKIIIEEHYSKPDIYGNRYWFTNIKNAETGETFSYSDNTNNSKWHARQAGYEFEEIHATETAHPIREFNRLSNPKVYMTPEEIIGKLNQWRLEPCKNI